MTLPEVKELSREELQTVILKMQEMLSEEQKKSLQEIIKECKKTDVDETTQPEQARMSQELVEEKMRQIQKWQEQIDEGEIYLNTEEYEDYSSGYWDADWITEYYDNQGVGDKLMYMIRFAEDCVDDMRYQEANEIYEWLWEMSVFTDNEFGDPVDIEVLEDNNLIHTDMKRLALLTLYADYQGLPLEKRAEDMYLYFSFDTFSKIHMEEIFHVGKEKLKDTERFWKDWIELLKSKNGDIEARLLKEAVLYCKGIEGLLEMAEENVSIHPSLYLAVMDEYEKEHFYEKIEEVGKDALDKIDVNLTIRGKIALKTAYVSSHLMHEEEMMQFCWECFCSDSTVKNYLRLFGTEEMAKRYGLRGKEVLINRIKGNQENNWRNSEFRRNMIDDYMYNSLNFYTGDFEKVKNISKNPKGSLGWSSSFIRSGIRLFLIYLYEKPLPSKAAASIAAYIGFPDIKDGESRMYFENEILEECHKHKVSEFWNYFQRWKRHFPMGEEERKKYLSWAEKIVYSRADAIVSGQHRNHYGEVAGLLAIVGEIKESMGVNGAGREIFVQYKNKYPRHSSFQKEMKYYFNM